MRRRGIRPSLLLAMSVSCTAGALWWPPLRFVITAGGRRGPCLAPPLPPPADVGDLPPPGDAGALELGMLAGDAGTHPRLDALIVAAMGLSTSPAWHELPYPLLGTP